MTGIAGRETPLPCEPMTNPVRNVAGWRTIAAVLLGAFVSGHPVLGSDGKEAGRQVGYLKGGVPAFTGKIDGFNKGKKADSL